MSLLIVLGLLTALIWLTIAFRSFRAVSIRLLVWTTALGLVLQIWLGYDFWNWDVGPIPITLDRIVLGLAFFLWFVGFVRHRATWLQLDSMDVCVLIWFASIAISTLAHDWQFRNKLPLSRLLFFNAMPLAIYFMIKHAPLELRHLRSIQWTWLGLGVTLSLLAVAEWQEWHDLIFPRYIVSSPFKEFLGRARGPLLNPMVNGMLMIAGGTVGFLAFWREGIRWRIWMVPLCAAIAFGIVATLTRSVWLSAAMVGFAFVLLPLGGKARLGLTLACVCFAAIAFPTLKQAASSFKRDQNVSAAEMAQSAELRPILATVALDMLRDHPLDGFGFGLYHKYKRPYHYTGRGGYQTQLGLPYTQHNVFLAYAVETGLLGLGWFLAMIVAIFWHSYRLATSRRANREFRQFGYFGVAIAIAYSVNGMFHDVSIIPMSNCLLLTAAATVGKAAALVEAHLPTTEGDERPSIVLPLGTACH